MRAQIVDQLPAYLAQDDFLRRFVGIFDELESTIEPQVGGLDNLVDITVAPPQMVQWLGSSWLDLYLLDPSMPIERRRRWVRALGYLLWWRGTRNGLVGLLEQVTGRRAEVTESGGVFRRGEAPHNPRHVRVRVEEGGWTSDDHLLAFVHRELPAEVTFELHVGDRRLWPPVGTG